MIKVLSGFTGPGGSTVAFNNLVNLFNDNGMDACLYGPQEWDGINCNFKKEEPPIGLGDTVIYHFRMPPTTRCSKLILSCHETELFPIKNYMNSRGFYQQRLSPDAIHFVSEFQKRWHDVEGVVIPNVVSKYKPVDSNLKGPRSAAIIGSIDRNKRVHKSIQRALEDGHSDIRLYGAITDGDYFHKEVLPYLGGKVSYKGVINDMREVYNAVQDVYHSSTIETFNLVKAECKYANVNYHGDVESDTQAEYWPNEKILESWNTLLNQ